MKLNKEKVLGIFHKILDYQASIAKALLVWVLCLLCFVCHGLFLAEFTSLFTYISLDERVIGFLYDDSIYYACLWAFYIGVLPYIRFGIKEFKSMNEAWLDYFAERRAIRIKALYQ